VFANPDPARTMSGTWLAQIDLDAPAPPTAMGCVQDSATFAYAAPVSPNQLLTIFGNQLTGPNDGTVTVRFDGAPAVLFYVSPRQINLVTPASLAGKESTEMSVETGGVAIGARRLPVAALTPSIFIDPAAVDACRVGDHIAAAGVSPLAIALNEDGTRNTCSNPAAPGSKIALFLNGLGADNRSLPPSGIVETPVPYSRAIEVRFGNGTIPGTVLSAESVAGSIGGLWKVVVRAPGEAVLFTNATIMVNGIAAAPAGVYFWVNPAP
jgi:uncharacterized protein (TIGR03437 family)